MPALGISYQEGAVVVLRQQQLLLRLDSLDLSKVPSANARVRELREGERERARSHAQIRKSDSYFAGRETDSSRCESTSRILFSVACVIGA